MPSSRGLVASAASAAPAAAPAPGPRKPALRAPPDAEPADRAPPRPLEHSILLTVTLCLLAAGAVMVYSASSAEALLSGEGDPARFLKRYVLYGALGLIAMRVCSRLSLRAVKRVTPALLLVGFLLTAAVMVPGVGVQVNGATRWLGAGPVQFQPSELLKVALVLYAASLLAARPRRVRTLEGLVKPLAIVVGAACVLLLAQPDMGTSLVICASIGALLVVAGARLRHLSMLGAALAVLTLVMALVEPYRRERLTAFLDPWADAGDTGFQAVQAMIAIGSGGPFGVGLGESVQKVFYLPEAHTDMILAIIGEELGLVGIGCVIVLYALLAYAGLRASKIAGDRYTKLLGAGLTALILCQATLNLFAVLGLAPLTGVPLPFISYGNSSMIVLLGAMGLVLNIAARGRRARVTEDDGDRRVRRRRAAAVAKRRQDRAQRRRARASAS
jgi:cell division protein FtsW